MKVKPEVSDYQSQIPGRLYLLINPVLDQLLDQQKEMNDGEQGLCHQAEQ